MKRYIIYPIIFLFCVSVASAFTIQELVDSYDYDYKDNDEGITYSVWVNNTDNDAESEHVIIGKTGNNPIFIY